MGRLFTGAFVAAILVFVWGYVSHSVLPIKEDVFLQLPEEDAIIGALRGSVSEPGMYYFPGFDRSRELTDEETAVFEAKYDAGPRGVIVFDTKGGKPISPKRLGIEFASNLLAALVAGIILSMSAAGFVGRVAIVMLMGVFAWLSISVSYWNWDGFSDAFTLMDAIDQVGGWLLGGLALAVAVRPRR